MSDEETKLEKQEKQRGKRSRGAEALLQQRRERAAMARHIMAHAFDLRNSANALCDFLTNWSLSEDEAEALELFVHVQTAWACCKASYRLADVAVSGS